MKKTPNMLAAPNLAIASLFQSRHHWRGFGEPDRSASSRHRNEQVG
jgi:hypothetical protein